MFTYFLIWPSWLINRDPCVLVSLARHILSRFGQAVWLVSWRTSVRSRFGSPFSSKRLSFVDIVIWLCPWQWNIKMALIATHHQQESPWWWQCSDKWLISLLPHLHTPFAPFSPSLISLVVSVAVKHHVYLINYFSIGVLEGCRKARHGVCSQHWRSPRFPRTPAISRGNSLSARPADVVMSRDLRLWRAAFVCVSIMMSWRLYCDLQLWYIACVYNDVMTAVSWLAAVAYRLSVSIMTSWRLYRDLRLWRIACLCAYNDVMTAVSWLALWRIACLCAYNDVMTAVSWLAAVAYRLSVCLWRHDGCIVTCGCGVSPVCASIMTAVSWLADLACRPCLRGHNYVMTPVACFLCLCGYNDVMAPVACFLCLRGYNDVVTPVASFLCLRGCIDVMTPVACFLCLRDYNDVMTPEARFLCAWL